MIHIYTSAWLHFLRHRDKIVLTIYITNKFMKESKTTCGINGFSPKWTSMYQKVKEVDLFIK